MSLINTRLELQKAGTQIAEKFLCMDSDGAAMLTIMVEQKNRPVIVQLQDV